MYRLGGCVAMPGCLEQGQPTQEMAAFNSAATTKR